MSENRYCVILPVKELRFAKSRLQVDPDIRHAFAQAFFSDILEVVTACPEVDQTIVISPDVVVLAEAADRGALPVEEATMQGHPDLNRAVDQALSAMRSAGFNGRVAVLPTDLPALTTNILANTLKRAARHHAAFVQDRSGFGTTLLTACSTHHLRAGYGIGSARRHLGLGSISLTKASLRIRNDVDTLEDLAEAKRLGLGPHTEAVSRELGRFWAAGGTRLVDSSDLRVVGHATRARDRVAYDDVVEHSAPGSSRSNGGAQ